MSKREGAGKIPAALTLSLAAGWIVTLLGTAVVAWLIQYQGIGEHSSGIAAMVIMLLAGCASALVAVKKVPEPRLVSCLVGGGVYFLSLLCCGALVFDGVRSGILPTAGVIAAGSLVVFLMGSRTKTKHKYKVPKVRL